MSTGRDVRQVCDACRYCWDDPNAQKDNAEPYVVTLKPLRSNGTGVNASVRTSQLFLHYWQSLPKMLLQKVVIGAVVWPLRWHLAAYKQPFRLGSYLQFGDRKPIPADCFLKQRKLSMAHYYGISNMCVCMLRYFTPFVFYGKKPWFLPWNSFFFLNLLVFYERKIVVSGIAAARSIRTRLRQPMALY